MSLTAADLRRAIERETQVGEDAAGPIERKVAWAGSASGPFAVDAETFSQMLGALAPEDPIAYGLHVVFDDGSWLEQEADDYGENPYWKMTYVPRRGDRPFTVLSGEEDLDDLQAAS